MSPRRPLVSLELGSPPRPSTSTSDDDDESAKKWYHYLPVIGTAVLIFMPHPSLLIVLVYYHLRVRHQPLLMITHLLATYTLTFLAYSSLIVCVSRDPGRVSVQSESEDDDGGDMGVQDALMSTDFDAFKPEKWCRKCWAPKPERTHHCGTCGRCVLKMDHHCPWLGQCVGHRTYPAFIHLLLCVTLLALYITIMCIFALHFAFNNVYSIDSTTPVHALFLALAGIIFTIVVGSFLLYHFYLIHTNQTTLESLSPFLLLRFLPPLPRGGHSLSDPPLEPELSYRQRVLVKDAHRDIRLYDIGWRKNWAQVFAYKHPFGWVYRMLCGGASAGDGKSYPRNPECDELLSRLAEELVKADKLR